MKKILGIGLCLFLAAACENNTSSQGAASNAFQAQETAPAQIQTLRGMYKKTGGQGRFYDCANGKSYPATDATNTLDSLYRAACEPAPYDSESVYAEVHGRFVSPLTPGDAGALVITQINLLRPKNRENTCIPYDFWCLGTEPFWHVLISETEGGIFLKMLGETRGRVFSWSAPQKNGDVWTYNTTETQTGEKLRVTVRQEVCSDGMSDQQFGYTVALILGEKTLSGCAERWDK